MQKKINIICILLLLALALGGASNWGTDASDFVAGWKSVSDEETVNEVGSSRHVWLTVRPKTLGDYPDSLQISGTSGNIPASIYDVGIQISGTEQRFDGIVTFLFALLLPAIAVFLWQMLSFLANVKKGEIFTVQNEKKLKWMAVVSFFFYLANLVDSLVDYFFAKENILLENYDVRINDVALYPLVLGFAFLLFAQIFAMARKMKEDQEFTV